MSSASSLNTLRKLPRTDLALTRFGLGGAPLGNLFAAVEESDAQATMQAAWDAGWRVFDTAPYYGYGLGERRLGHALRSLPRDELVLSSKVGRLIKPLAAGATATRQPGDAWVAPPPFEAVYDYSAAGLRRSLEDSLQRLGVAYLDVALVHDIGTLTHGERQAHHAAQLAAGGWRELEAMKREGLVRAIGLGVNECEAVLEALNHIDLDISLLAGRYTLLEQGALAPLFEACTARGVGILAGGVFNSGILVTGPKPGATYNYEAAPTAMLQRAEALQRVCAEFGVPLAAAALQFPYANPVVVCTLVGARRPSEVAQAIAWAQHPIPATLWAALREQGLLDARAPVPGA